MIIAVKKFEIIDSLLFIDGIGIIEGVNVKEWRDVSYELIFEGINISYQKTLAKAHHPEITTQYAKNGENYDKGWFTTKEYAGIDISDIALGDYCLSLKIITPSITKMAKLYAMSPQVFENNQFSLNINHADNSLVIRSYQQDITIANFHTNKFTIVGKYCDTQGNQIQTVSGSTSHCSVQFAGKNNQLIIHPKANLKNVDIEFLMDNAVIEIAENVRMKGNWRIGHHCVMKIGKNSSSTNPVYITCAEGANIIIGEDCMFATNNQIRTDDAHPIYDVNTGNRINPSKDVVLGNHVWIGYGAMLLGGAKVGDGSIIGAGALVNKVHSNNCLVVGTPAKTVKHDVFWERSPLLLTSKGAKNYTQEELQSKSYCQKTQLDN